MNVRRILAVVFGVITLGAVAGALQLGGARSLGGVVVLGDHAAQIARALDAEPKEGEAPSLTVVSLEAWYKLDYVSDIRPLVDIPLGDADWMVRIIRVHPFGSRKILLLNVKQWMEGEELDPDCIVRIVQREARQLGAAKSPALCAKELPAAHRLTVLPFGLGTI